MNRLAPDHVQVHLLLVLGRKKFDIRLARSLTRPKLTIELHPTGDGQVQHGLADRVPHEHATLAILLVTLKAERARGVFLPSLGAGRLLGIDHLLLEVLGPALKDEILRCHRRLLRQQPEPEPGRARPRDCQS